MASHAPAPGGLACTHDSFVSVTVDPQGYNLHTNRAVYHHHVPLWLGEGGLNSHCDFPNEKEKPKVFLTCLHAMHLLCEFVCVCFLCLSTDAMGHCVC